MGNIAPTLPAEQRRSTSSSKSTFQPEQTPLRTIKTQKSVSSLVLSQDRVQPSKPSSTKPPEDNRQIQHHFVNPAPPRSLNMPRASIDMGYLFRYSGKQTQQPIPSHQLYVPYIVIERCREPNKEQPVPHFKDLNPKLLIGNFSFGTTVAEEKKRKRARLRTSSIK